MIKKILSCVTCILKTTYANTYFDEFNDKHRKQRTSWFLTTNIGSDEDVEIVHQSEIYGFDYEK